jgi:AmiR/NasT family two-component response regulator
VAQLREALVTRTVIGQATGIVAGRLRVSTETAWQILRRASTDSNIKTRRVAAVVVASHDGLRPPEDDPIADAVAPILGLPPVTRD